MRIACPSCNAVYQVPDEQLGEGRVVRCVRCGTDWSPVVSVPAETAPAESMPAEKMPAEKVPVEKGGVEMRPEALPEPPLEPAPPQDADPPPPIRQMVLDDNPVVTVAPVTVAPVTVTAVPAPGRRGGPWLAIAWVMSVLAVIGGVAALVVWREAVMHAWPPSIRAYVAVGLAARP